MTIADLDRKLPTLKYPVIVYGAGIVGRHILEMIGKKNIVFFVDKNKKGNIDGLAIKDLGYLTAKFPILIASIIWEREIYHQLQKLGFRPYPYSLLNFRHPHIFNYHDFVLLHKSLKDKVNIKKARKLWTDSESIRVYDAILDFRKKYYFDIQMDSIMTDDPEYFIPELKLNNEVFVDCGPYSVEGSTITDFLKYASGKVYAFELDKINYRKLIKRVKGENICIYNLGVYKTNGYIPAMVNAGRESRLTDYNKSLYYPVKEEARREMARVVKLDDFLRETPTFIKMDIEGSEYDALTGLQKTVKRYKPKLAICVYHKPSDLWQIPMFVKKLNPAYKFYLRHHSREVSETVMYAV